jgi:ornithine cyclodeaminase
MGRDVLILRENEIRAALDMPSCIEATKSAFAAYSTGGAELPAVIHLNVPGSSESSGEVHVKAGFLHGSSTYAVKFASSFSGTNDGVVIVFDAATGAPAALLFDNGCITDIRTGAAGGVAASLLARENTRTVAVLGTGTQARCQLEALSLVRPFEEVRIWGRTTERAAALAEELSTAGAGGFLAKSAASPEEAVRGADVVITATASSEPLVQDAWLEPGVHITALGSDGAGKQELASGVLKRADLVVADSRSQCFERGELQHVSESDLRAPVVEIGEILAGKAAGRTRDDEITVCDLTGVGVQDATAASLVLERAAATGAGAHLEI